MRAAREIVPGVRAADVSRLGDEFPELSAAMRTSCGRTAAAVLSGGWEMLEHAFDLTEPLDWHKDPRTDYRWPREFYADLPLHRLPGGADVKYVWELGRQQYAVELARGWLFEQESRYAQRAREIVLNWIDENPLYEGIHWTSPLEAAMRTISWLWTVATLGDWDGWRDGELQQINASLAEHAAYLEQHLEFYSSPYNHLIGQATALYLLGYAFPHDSSASSWKTLGRDVLLKHGPEQFYLDGFCVEQATGYHFYTLGFLMMAVAVARTAGEPLAALEPVVHRAALAGLKFRQPDGRWPAIGDVDSARAIPVHHDDFWRFDSLCAVAAVLFHDRELKIRETEPGAELYWLLGCDGLREWQQLPSGRSQTRSALLADAGYAIAGNGGDWLLFDAGPIAAGLFPGATPSVAHGHADTLQVLYYADGKPVLQDCGMPFYGGDPEWVRYFRSAAAHNTLEVEAAPMVRDAGALAWSHATRRPQLDAQFSDDVWLAYGRAEWSPGVIVERLLLCLRGEGLWIADLIETDRPRQVRWYWQLPMLDHGELSRRADGSLAVDLSEFQFTCTSSLPGLEGHLQPARENRPEGWHCLGYGMRQTGLRLALQQLVLRRGLVLTFAGGSQRRIQIDVHGETLQQAAAASILPSQQFAWKHARWTVHMPVCNADGFAAAAISAAPSFT